MTGGVFSSVLNSGNLNEYRKTSPPCITRFWLDGLGKTGIGGCGGAFFPQVTENKTTVQETKNRRQKRKRCRLRWILDPAACILQYEPTQILILHYIRQCFVNVVSVDQNVLDFQFRCAEGNIIQQFFHDGVKSTRADVFCTVIHFRRQMRELGKRLFGK